MKVEISKIITAERIRKSVTNIAELAANIKQHGLFHPITVMQGISESGGAYQLLAGLRRLKAVQSLGWAEVDVTVVSPKDAEEALCIEISENEQREQFTSAEKLDYGRQLERLESLKARERMSQGGKGGVKQGVDDRPNLRTREIVGKQIGMSGRTYDRLKCIADTAPQLLEKIDSNQHSINSAYEESRAVKKAATFPVPQDNVPKIPKGDTRRSDEEPSLAQAPAKMPNAVRPAARLPVPEAAKPSASPYTSPSAPPLPRAIPESPKLVDRVTELEQQLRAERGRAATAESELARLKELRHNDILHKDSIIDSLTRQNAELKEALSAALLKIQESEETENAEFD